MKDPLVFCELIQESLDYIAGYLSGTTYDGYVRDPMRRDAVSMRLQVIANSVKDLLTGWPELSAQFPHIPWNDIVRFRDKISHHYEAVDYAVVWEIATEHTGMLRDALPEITAFLAHVSSE